MYQQVFESFKKATEANVQMQQEMFKKWFGMWPGTSLTLPNVGEQMEQFQKKWAETIKEAIKQQREFTDAQFKAGLDNIEKAFKLGEAKTPEELRAKTIELWKACFNSLKHSYEAQFRNFQSGVEKWNELVCKTAV